MNQTKNCVDKKKSNNQIFTLTVIENNSICDKFFKTRKLETQDRWSYIQRHFFFSSFFMLHIRAD